MEALLEQCAHLADPTPLTWLCQAPGVVQAHTEVLAHHLISWPETSLLKVLKGIPSEGLEPLLVRALELIPLERLAVLSILERNLKHQFPAAYEAYLQALEMLP